MTISRASLARRAWIVPLCVVIVTIAAVIVAGSRTSFYRTQGSVVAYGTGTAVSTPVGLATTYAALIVQDDGVIAAVSRAVHEPPAVVRSRLSATQPPQTALIDVTYVDEDAKTSFRGAVAAIHAVTGINPAARTIPPGALRVVSAPGAPSEQRSKLPAGPVPIGIVIGLLLGIALLIAWERSDPYADDAKTLERELGLPVTDVGIGSKGVSLTVLQQRWLRLADNSSAKIALVSTTNTSGSAAASIYARVEEAGSPTGVTYLVSRVPGTAENDDLETMAADVVVLVVVRGDRIAPIRRSVSALRSLGAQPDWALLAEPGKS
jgi:hypothetical protein